MSDMIGRRKEKSNLSPFLLLSAFEAPACPSHLTSNAKLSMDVQKSSKKSSRNPLHFLGQLTRKIIGQNNVLEHLPTQPSHLTSSAGLSMGFQKSSGLVTGCRAQNWLLAYIQVDRPATRWGCCSFQVKLRARQATPSSHGTVQLGTMARVECDGTTCWRIRPDQLMPVPHSALVLHLSWQMAHLLTSAGEKIMKI